MIELELLLKNGPWKELFKGTIEKTPIEIYTNPELAILVLLIEKEGEKTIGIVLELFKVFNAKGELDSFLSSLPKEAIAITKHSKQETEKFLVISSKPSYSAYEEEKTNLEIELLIKNLAENTATIKSVSKAYDLELTEIKDTPEETKEAFFAQPLLMQFISPLPRKAIVPTEETRIISFGEVVLGVTKEGTLSKEPMALFQKTIISEGKGPERRHAMHLLLEGCLLSGATAIIFDSQNLFSGITTPTNRIEDLQKFKIEQDPMGFPLKDFFAGEQIKIKLSTINPEGFVNIFGFGDNQASKKIVQLMKENKQETIQELAKQMSETATEGTFNEYQKNLAIRFLKLIESMNKNIFGEKPDISQIVKGGVKGIGRASIIHTENIDNRTALLLLDSLSNIFFEFFSQIGPTKNLKAVFFLPNALKMVSEEEQNFLTKEIIENFKKLEKYGIGFVFEAEKETELPKTIRDFAEARITLIKGTDAGIHLKNQKIYRAYLRPALSTCTELQ